MDAKSDIDEKQGLEHIEYTRSNDETASPEDADFVAKEKLLRKLDTFIAPVMMLLMLISYLDRGNIGFAATQGMTKTLKLKPQQLNVRNA